MVPSGEGPFGLEDAKRPGLLQPRHQGGVQIVPDPRQEFGAHGLDPRLFNRVENLGRLGVGGAHTGVDPRVMIGQTQGQAVGLASQGRALVTGGVAWGMRQSQYPASQLGSVRPEHHLQLRLLGQGAGGVAERAFEGFGGSVRGGHAPQLIFSRR